MKKAIEFITGHQSFAVAAHVNPEGDAIGSTLAMVQLLRQMGKSAHPYNRDPAPGSVAFLPGASEIVREVGKLPEVEAVIILDSGDLERPGPEFREFIGSRPVLNIDHHHTNTNFGDINWVEAEARRRRRGLFQAVVGSQDVPLRELETSLGPRMTPFLLQASRSLQEKAQELAAELEVNRIEFHGKTRSPAGGRRRA